MQLLIVASVCLTAAIHMTLAECPPEAADFDFAGKYWQANVVFNGTPTSAVSGVAIDTDGTQIASERYTFQVVKYFKDNSGHRLQAVDIMREYVLGGPCDKPLVSGSYSSHLIFATGTTGFSVPACGGTIPWDCVPDTARQGLQRQTC